MYPTIYLAGKDDGTQALQEAILADSGHLAVGFPLEDCPGAIA
jgi:hypothetical protein